MRRTRRQHIRNLDATEKLEISFLVQRLVQKDDCILSRVERVWTKRLQKSCADLQIDKAYWRIGHISHFSSFIQENSQTHIDT